MTEVWLRSNRRVLLLAMIPVAAVGGLGYYVLDSKFLSLPAVLKAIWLGFVGLMLIGLIRQIMQPRIAYHDGRVLFYLRSGSPLAVPLPVLEAFFQGQGPAHLPGETHLGTKSINLVARLSQRETDWHEREVKSVLGCWSEGYITIRGTWCEPITEEVIRRLNHRLREVSRSKQDHGVKNP